MVSSLSFRAPLALWHLAHRGTGAGPGVRSGTGTPPATVGARLPASGGTRARQARAGGGGGGGCGRGGRAGGADPSAHGVRAGPAARGAGERGLHGGVRTPEQSPRVRSWGVAHRRTRGGGTGLRLGWEISPGGPVAPRLDVETSLSHNFMNQGLAHGSVLAQTPGTLPRLLLSFSIL